MAGPLSAAGGYTATGFCGWNARSASVHGTWFLTSASCSVKLPLSYCCLLLSPLRWPLWLLLPCRQQARVSEVASGAWGLWCVYEEEMVRTVCPKHLSLVPEAPPWTPVASAAAWGWTATNGYSEWPEEHAKSWGAENTERLQRQKTRRLVTHPKHTSHLRIQCKCLSLTVLAMPLNAEVCLHQWSSCTRQLFHEEWQNTMQKGNCFAIWGFQGICLPSFTSWCPSGSVGILTPFTMWLLVIRILIHS